MIELTTSDKLIISKHVDITIANKQFGLRMDTFDNKDYSVVFYEKGNNCDIECYAADWLNEDAALALFEQIRNDPIAYA